MLAIILSRKINVLSFKALLTIGKEDESRERDILPFLLMVNEKGAVTAADVNREFLMEPEGHVFGGRWLSAMHDYKMIEPFNAWRLGPPNYAKDVFRLTDIGREMASARKILIPEQGEYMIHLTDDVLIKDEWLACLHHKGAMPHQDFEEIGRSTGHNKSAPRSVPIERSDIERWKGKAISLPAQKMSVIRIIDMEEKVELSKNKINVEVRVVLTDNGKKLVRVINGDSIADYAHEFEMDFQDVLMRVLTSNGMLYDVRTSSALLNKTQITEDIVREGTIKVPSTELDLEDLGNFTVSGLDSMPVLPVDIPAATVWVKMGLEQRIDDYITEDEYGVVRNEVASELSERFSEADLLEQIPEYYDVIKEKQKIQQDGGAVFWHLMAPHDLRPVRGD